MKHSTFPRDLDATPLPKQGRPTTRPLGGGETYELGHYTQEVYNAAFVLVRPDDNWKYPIDAQVSIPDAVDIDAAVALIEDAIGYFAGSLAEVTRDGRTVRFQAAGYYVDIGS